MMRPPSSSPAESAYWSSLTELTRPSVWSRAIGGLARPGHGARITVACPPIVNVPEDSGRYYYPFLGQRPGYGRFEVEPPPNRRLPRPAPSYYREWGTSR